MSTRDEASKQKNLGEALCTNWKNAKNEAYQNKPGVKKGGKPGGKKGKGHRKTRPKGPLEDRMQGRIILDNRGGRRNPREEVKLLEVKLIYTGGKKQLVPPVSSEGDREVRVR